MRSILSFTATCSLLAICATSPALAQVQSAPAEADDVTGDIIVTAQKRDQRLQDVQASVTAVGRSELLQRGVTDVKDILGSVPGLAFNQNDRSQTKYNIRGLATTSSSPTVGIFLDDVALTTQGSDFSGAFDVIFFDIERLEVLKGPQGTLYGGSAMGGAIKYVSSRPDLSNFKGEVAASGATTAHGDASYRGEAIINLPIVQDKLALRAGFYYMHEGGYVDNVAGGLVSNPSVSTTARPVITRQTAPSLSKLSEDDVNYANIYIGKVSLLWQPDPSWSIRPAFMWQSTRLHSEPDIFTNQGGLTASYRQLSKKNDEGRLYDLQVDKELGAVQLTSLTAYFDRDLYFTRDYSFEIARLTGGVTSPFYADDSLAIYPTRTKTFSQEWRIGSAPGTKSSLTWIAGLFYSNQKEQFTQTVNTINPAAPTVPVFPNNLAFFAQAKSRLRQYAAFGEATLHVTDAFDVTAGVRAFRISQSTNQVSNGPLAGGASTQQGSGVEKGVNPKFGLAYKLSRDNMVYANAAKGFRPGGLNVGTFPNTAVCQADLGTVGLTSRPTLYKSDNVWTYEAGSKNQLADGKVTVNGAGFYTKWKDIQQRVFLANCGFGFTANFGTAEIKGAELELTVKPVTGFQLGGSLTYTDTQITKAAVGTTAQVGDQIQYVPKWMGSAFASYSFPVTGSWNAMLRGDYQYRSRQRYVYDRTRIVTFPDRTTLAVPNEAEFQEGSSVVNMVASVGNGETDIRLYVNNLTDTHPLSRVIVSLPERAQTLRPRTIGVEVRQKF